jgi:arsenate reductase
MYSMKLLFICTHNRCRSILGEAITNYEGKGLITAASAGSEPSGQVHPLTIHYLQKHGFDTSGLRSKSWDELADFQPDYVVTVCDSAAREPCPLWMGSAARVHWGLADPSRLADESTQQQDQAFGRIIRTIAARIGKITALLDMGIMPGSEEMDRQLNRLANYFPQE